MIKQRIQSLTDDELRECWDAIEKYNHEGVMGDTLVRRIRNEIASELGNENWDAGCSTVIIPSILHEIARRHYAEKDLA